MPPRFLLAAGWAVPRCLPAANDNPPAVAGQDFARRVLLREALRHFAAHGAGAAEQARINAEHAFFAGKRGDYLHWMAMGRALDRRTLEARAAPDVR